MSQIFEELDYEKTPLGEISLRKRTEPRLDNVLIYEVKLGDEFLMSSLFVEAEEQLSTLGLKRLKKNGHQHDLSVVVGGLGLGYTALTAVKDEAVARLRTIDVMQPVIRWHQQGLLPIGNELAVNPKSELVHGDFFAIATDDKIGVLDDSRVHAILLDIDHSPSHWLNQGNSGFYHRESLQKMISKIVPGGIFGLWSNERPDAEFTKLLNQVFSDTEEHVVSFANPYSGGESINSVYISTV
ncbi:MAG: spermidine synthase [Arenicella sp.]|jgi:spermidine synthase